MAATSYTFPDSAVNTILLRNSGFEFRGSRHLYLNLTLPLGKDSVVGLGAGPVRAGSIGRDTPGNGELTEPPPKKAGDVTSRPIHGEISAS